MKRVNVLEYRRYRYLKLAALTCAVAAAAYFFDSPPLGPSGSTWLGYTLGTGCAVLVMLLLWYGVTRSRIPAQAERRQPEAAGDPLDNQATQERRRHETRWDWRRAMTLSGWLSWHVYFGLATLFLATLHSGFHFDWNIHTLLYLLLILVVLTGIYGVYAYLQYPRLMTENLGEDTLGSLLDDIAELDQLTWANVLRLPDQYTEIVQQERLQTRIAGNYLEVLRGKPRHCATRHAIAHLQSLQEHSDHAESQILRTIIAQLLRKEAQLKRARLDCMYQARLRFWLYFHVPLAFGLLAAMLAHVNAVFFFW